MFQDIWTIAKKELKACFKDKATLLLIVAVPFFVVFGYSMLTVFMGNSDKDTEDEAETVSYSINAPEYMQDGFKELHIQPAAPNELNDLKNKIADKECDLLIVFPEDFMLSDTGDAATLSNVEIYFNSSQNTSVNLYTIVNSYLEAFQPRAFFVNSSPDGAYDLADERDQMFELISLLLPMVILMAVFMVSMNLSAESIAGDKERGFLNLMLITPVKRKSIAAGKSLSIFITTTIAGISAFIGMAVALPQLAKSFGFEDGSFYSGSEYLLLFGVAISAVFALASMLLIVSTLSKDVKQASNIASIVLMVLMIACMLTSSESFGEMIKNLGLWNAAIPAWNTTLIMKDIMSLDYSPIFAGITCGANLVFCVISIILVGHFFENEHIVNG